MPLWYSTLAGNLRLQQQVRLGRREAHRLRAFFQSDLRFADLWCSESTDGSITVGGNLHDANDYPPLLEFIGSTHTPVPVLMSQVNVPGIPAWYMPRFIPVDWGKNRPAR